LAHDGDPEAIDFPRPLLNRPGLDMSFAGLKTAVARAAEAEALTDARMANICASFQAAIVDVLSEKARRALEDFNPGNDSGMRFVVAGGVASNKAIRAGLEKVADAAGAVLIAPPMRHCTG
jgi:N6-L-threonylcarbamoyladenine synthase